MLTSSCWRMSRLLRLDEDTVENGTGQSPTESMSQEARTRLLWSCYILDAFVGSGVVQNLCWAQSAPKAPLPCAEDEFLHQASSTVSAYMDAGEVPGDISGTSYSVRAHICRLLRLRTQVLRYALSSSPFPHLFSFGDLLTVDRCIREGDPNTQFPWDIGSSFINSILSKHGTLTCHDIFYSKI